MKKYAKFPVEKIQLLAFHASHRENLLPDKWNNIIIASICIFCKNAPFPNQKGRGFEKAPFSKGSLLYGE
jgi:hypothetical protein